jgi:hypothetical protein
MSETLYKFLNDDGSPWSSVSGGGPGTTETWFLPKGKRPGRWMPEIRDIVLHVRGYRLCRPIGIALGIGPVLYRAEARGEQLTTGSWVTTGQARLLEHLEAWNIRTAVLFAADCAERILPIFEKQKPGDDRVRASLKVLRDFANGKATRDDLERVWVAGERAWGKCTVRPVTRKSRESTLTKAGDELTWKIARACWDAAFRTAGHISWASWTTIHAINALDSGGSNQREYTWQSKRLLHYIQR